MSSCSAYFSLGDRSGLGLTYEVEELNDNFSILDEVYSVSRRSNIVDYRTRLIRALFNLIAHIDYLHE